MNLPVFITAILWLFPTLALICYQMYYAMISKNAFGTYAYFIIFFVSAVFCFCGMNNYKKLGQRALIWVFIGLGFLLFALVELSNNIFVISIFISKIGSPFFISLLGIIPFVIASILMLRVNKEPVPIYGWLLGLTSFVILVVLCLMSNLIIFGSNMFLVLTLGNQIPCFVLIGLLLVVLIKHCSRTIWKPWILLTLGLFCASLGHLSMWFHVVAVVLILGSVCIMFMQFKNNAKTLNFVIASATLIILLAAFMAMSWYDLFSAQGQNILVIIALISVNIALASSFAFLVGTASLRKANDMGNPLVWATSGLIMISAGFFLPYMLESFNLFQNAVMARDVLLSLGAMLVCVGVVIDNQQQRELRFE